MIAAAAAVPQPDRSVRGACHRLAAFPHQTNLSSVVRQTAVINIMALGMTHRSSSPGGIDLSVGSILAMARACSGPWRWRRACPSRWASLIGIADRPVLRVRERRDDYAICASTPFIVTLGTLGIFRGLDADHLQRAAGAPDPGRLLLPGRGNLLGVPFVLVGAGWLCAVATHVCSNIPSWAATPSPSAAIRAPRYYAGVPVAFHTTAVYAIAGMLTGLAGMIEASRLMTGQPTAGQGYELQAIAAVVIGGGSLHGGEGSVVGTLIGAFIMGLLSNGSDLLGINPYWQQAIIGAMIIAAVGFDEYRKRRFASA